MGPGVGGVPGGVVPGAVNGIIAPPRVGTVIGGLGGKLWWIGGSGGSPEPS